jgi:hypothetical protein
MPSIVLEQIIELYTLQLTQIKESRDLEHNSQVLQVYVTNNLWSEESRSEASRRTGLEVGGGRESVALRESRATEEEPRGLQIRRTHRNRWFNFIRCPPSASGSGPRHYVIINTKCCGPAYISRLRRCGRIQIKKRFYNRRISLENREKGTRNRTIDEDDAEAALRRSDGREAGVTAKRRQHLVLDDGGDIQLPQGRSRPTRTDNPHPPPRPRTKRIGFS